MAASDQSPGDDIRLSAHQLSVQKRFRWINDHIRELYPADVAGNGHAERVEFVCECPNDRCFQIVSLPLADYDRLCAGRAWVIAREHTALVAA